MTKTTAPVYGEGLNLQEPLGMSVIMTKAFGLHDLVKESGTAQGEGFLARVGKYVHEFTYGQGKTTEEVWSSLDALTLQESDLRSYVFLFDTGPLLMRFTSLWYDQALPVVTLPATYAASLMATVVPPGVVQNLIPPWRAFLIRLPEGAITREDGSSYLWIEVMAEEDSRGVLLWTVNLRADTCGVFQHLATAEDLLRASRSAVPDVTPEKFKDRLGDTSDEESRARELAIRLVISLCLAMSAGGDPVKPKNNAARGNVRRSGPPEVRLYQVGAPMELDLRDEVRAYQRGGKPAQRTSPSVQTLVRWHWKRQHHGSKNALVKWIRVAPYWRGGEDLPVKVKETNVIG